MNKRHKNTGFSLVDAIVASVILFIIVLGALQYRYHAVLEIRKAKAYLKAVEIAEIFCNGWRGVCGSDTYDPITALSDIMDISYGYDWNPPDDEYYLFDCYDITLDDMTMTATLSYKDLDDGLRELNVSISYPFGNVGGATYAISLQWLAMFMPPPSNNTNNRVLRITTYSYCTD